MSSTFFINLSNHPSSTWHEKQLMEARKIGIIWDMSFPMIPPEWSTEQVAVLVENYNRKIKEILPTPNDGSVIHVMGESVFTFKLVTVLIKEGYTVVASTTEHITNYEGDKKISEFKFVQFRPYV